jgi:hypothetical protein
MRWAILTCALAALGCPKVPTPQPAPATTPAVAQPATPKRMTREEFKAKVIGKTTKEILAVLGKPHNTNEYPNGKQTWIYKELTYDPITDKTDILAFVSITRGVADSVHF